jgi:putative MFS transporter
MVTIAERLGNLPLGRFHWRLLVLTMVGWAFDSMDTGIVAFVVATMTKSWHLTSGQSGNILSIGLVGMACGAILSGWMADLMGRKRLFAATLVFYSLATGLCGLAWNYESLLLFRFLVGFGVGGQLPVAVTLMSEYSPAKYRGRMIVLLESAWAIGWLIAALIAYFIIPVYGWQVAFFIGVLPALAVVIIWQQVPESALYLVSKGRYREAHELVASIESELGVPVGQPPDPASEGQCEPQVGFGELWKGVYGKRTICLWILWFGLVFSYYGIFQWLPSLLAQSGHSLIRSFEFTLWMTLAQIPGYFTAAYLVDRIGRKITLSSFLAASAVCACLFGYATDSSGLLLWGCLMSFFNLGAWGVVYTYTPELYPTAARATGVGFAAGFGRIGGILGPFVVGLIMINKEAFSTVFLLFTGVLLLTALNVFLFGEETMQKSLDDISHQ